LIIVVFAFNSDLHIAVFAAFVLATAILVEILLVIFGLEKLFKVLGLVHWGG
jgi:hypothetical protein